MSSLIHSPVFERDGELFTTSMEIAEGAYVQHASVMSLVRAHLTDLEDFGRVRFEIVPFETNGGTQSREVAYLNERQATLLFTHMRSNEIVAAFKKRLVKTFFDLAYHKTDPLRVLNDPVQLRGLLSNYAQRVEALEATVTEQAPKVAALDAIADTAFLYCMRDAAKHLGWNPNDLITWLRCEHWIFRNHAMQRWVAYQTTIEADWLTHKIVTIGEDERGQPRTVPQVMVTSKGLARIATVFEKQRADRASTALCGTRASA